MKALVNSETRFNQVFKQSIETLLFDCFGQPTEQAARELRYQTVVAIWSSLEVLIKDQLIQIINWKPELAKKLTTDEIAKKRFELPKLTYEELEDRNFNFQNCMGDMLIKQRDASDLLTLKAAIGAIWGKNELYKRLDTPEIRLLNLQRHLIVHRRGVVDKKYLSQSSESLSEGEHIEALPSTLVKYYRATADVGKIACSSFLEICQSNS